MAYTLQVGRQAMEERVGFIVSSVENLAEKLQAYSDGKVNIKDAYYGQVKHNQDTFAAFCSDEDMQKVIGQWLVHKKLSKVLDIWTKGVEFDWSKLYREVKPKRIGLPAYPFAKERYWINTASGSEATKGMTTPVLHPLLHVNTSDITQQRYSCTFTGEEFFLKDHQVLGQKVLPGVAYLEMARASIEKGVPLQPESRILELRNTVWLNTLAVEGNQNVSIVLVEKNESGSSIDQLHYEICSGGSEEKIVHCQGQVVFGLKNVPAKIDLARLKEQMRREIIEGRSLYSALTKMGLNYGPAFQGVRSIFLGEEQLVAHLHLPSVVDSGNGKSNPDDFLLHPTLMDSALQSSIALVADLNEIHSKPFVPFALEFLRIVSACTAEMFSWIRYSPGSKPEDNIIKLDIDLCDHEGNVCVQMRGFSYRVLKSEIKSIQKNTINHSIDENGAGIENSSPLDDTYYQKLIESVLSNKVTIDEAVNLGFRYK
jgi:acyl transferase domain-containing protein